MKKKIFSIFGPILLALFLLIVFFLAPFKIDLGNKSVLDTAATSMATNVLTGDAIKNKAISSKEYVPFFGSSELSRISPFHPSALAQKYNRNYQPFLLGAPGTQSLTQAMMMQSIGNELSHKKVVFIISPQWFVKEGVTKDYFNAYFSNLQIYQWLDNLAEITESDKFLAQRLLDFSKTKEDVQLTNALTKVKNGTQPNLLDKSYIHLMLNVYSKEDEWFGKFNLVGKEDAVKKAAERLPNQYNLTTLDQLAIKMGKKATSNNKFEISNFFYNTNIKGKLNHLKNSQMQFDYRFSPEFSDFQLVLNQLAQKNADVLFIIPPVNKRWTDFTGLSQEMLQEFAKKIKYQLESQGFENIVDLTQECNTPYFMADTIHLGWRGWLVVDQYVAPFLEQEQAKMPVYKLNEFFYSKEWQQKDPNTINK